MNSLAILVDLGGVQPVAECASGQHVDLTIAENLGLHPVYREDVGAQVGLG